MDRYELFQIGHALATTRAALTNAREASTGYVARNAYNDGTTDDTPTGKVFSDLITAIDALVAAESRLGALAQRGMRCE